MGCRCQSLCSQAQDGQSPSLTLSAQRSLIHFLISPTDWVWSFSLCITMAQMLQCTIHFPSELRSFCSCRYEARTERVTLSKCKQKIPFHSHSLPATMFSSLIFQEATNTMYTYIFACTSKWETPPFLYNLWNKLNALTNCPKFQWCNNRGLFLAHVRIQSDRSTTVFFMSHWLSQCPLIWWLCQFWGLGASASLSMSQQRQEDRTWWSKGLGGADLRMTCNWPDLYHIDTYDHRKSSLGFWPEYRGNGEWWAHSSFCYTYQNAVPYLALLTLQQNL